MSVSFLMRNTRPSLAYRKTAGDTDAMPIVVFLTGFASDMEGTKASYLAALCEKRRQSFLRFDYSGHGASEGRFEDGTIGLWCDDTVAVIDNLTQGPLLLIGSSMGGWIGLLAALARKDRVAGYIGLAAAPDFTRDIPAQMTELQKHQMETQGFFPLPSTYGDNPPVVTQALLEDGDRHCLLHAPIELSCPVRLIQGMKDNEVPWQTAHRILNAVTGTDKKVYLREDGDHRLSTPEDLALLGTLVSELSDKP